MAAKACKTEFSPILTELFNGSIETGTVLLDMMTAIIVPRLKKAYLSPSELSNYRPVSNLSILSKLLERLVDLLNIWTIIIFSQLTIRHIGGFTLRSGHFFN